MRRYFPAGVRSFHECLLTRGERDRVLAGQERFRSLAPAFYRASDACVLVYSLADPSPPSTVTASIKSWFADFHDKCPVGTGATGGQDDAAEEDDEEEEQLRRFCWVCVGAKADEADPARASELSAAVERTLEELLPRRSGRQAAEAARRARERRKGKAPTVSVEVLHAPQERSGAPRKIRRAKRPVGQPAAPAPGRAPEPAPSSTAGTSSAGASTATTSATATPTFELDEPIADLLVATSPPTAPAHFGTAGAPPAVWLGGPFGKEGHVLEDGEGGGAVDVGESAVKDGEDDEGESEEEPEEERSEAERFADEGIKHFQRTSAKTGEGVDEVCVSSVTPTLLLQPAHHTSLPSSRSHAASPTSPDEYSPRVRTRGSLTRTSTPARPTVAGAPSGAGPSQRT